MTVLWKTYRDLADLAPQTVAGSPRVPLSSSREAAGDTPVSPPCGRWKCDPQGCWAADCWVDDDRGE